MTVADWDIGPEIGRLVLRVVPGFPVAWPLIPPDTWTPVAPEFDVRLRDGSVQSFPLQETVLGAETLWTATLTAVQTTALRYGAACRLVDSGAVIAAGPLRVLSGWRGEEPVTLETRIVAGPPGSGTGGLSVIDNGDGTYTLTDTGGQLVDNGDGTLTLTA